MRPEEEEEDMHVFQPDEELEGENVEGGRESVAYRVELVRGAGDSVASDRQLQVSLYYVVSSFSTSCEQKH
jgi:hypothetical protein